MALTLELKPGERLMVGDCIITNSGQRTRLLIEGETPVLREKDVMTYSRADSPAKRIYLALQLMYLAKNPDVHRDVYFALVRDLTAAAPSTLPFIESINTEIAAGDIYRALKGAAKLIAHESQLMGKSAGADEQRTG